MTSSEVKAPEAHPIVTTLPWLGVAGVLLGAMIATCTGRLMGHFTAVREEFHSNILGLNVRLGNYLTDHRFLGLGYAFAPHSTGSAAAGRAAKVLGLQVRQQAFTLAISDSFLLVAACCVACLLVVAFMSRVPTQYRQVVAAPVEAK